jgi:uncharacterized protein YggE
MSHAAPRPAGVEPSVTVLGEAAIRTEPDEALVWITLSAVAPAPGSALADVAQRSEKLGEMLDELHLAREERSTAGVTVEEEFDHTQEGRQSRGHRARASVSVRVADNDLIGRLMMRASEELDARISGPHWRISASNPAWLEVATRAAESAKAKASAYAAGVQTRLGTLISLSEPEHHLHHGGLRLRSASGGEDMHIEGGEQEVTAAVSATFKLEPL